MKPLITLRHPFFVNSKSLLAKLWLLLLLFCVFPGLKANGADYFWVGGSGNWSDIKHWVTSSGGKVNYLQIPTPADDVHFDKNSFVSAGQTVNLDAGNAVCRNVDWTGALNNPAFKAISPNNSIRIYGSLTLIAGMSWSISNSLPSPTFIDIIFESVSPGRTIKTAGQQLNNVTFNGIGGGWSLTDSLQCAGTIKLINGSLDTKGHGINCSVFSSVSSNVRALSMVKSTITAGTWTVTGSNFLLSAGNSAIYCGALSHHGGTTLDPSTYNNVVFQGGSNKMSAANCTFNKITGPNVLFNYSGSGNTINSLTVSNGMPGNTSNIGFTNDVIHKLVVHGLAVVSGGNKIDTATFYDDAIINGSNTFGILTFSVGGTYTLQDNNTQLITSSLKANGTCTNAIAVQSANAGSPATMKQASGTVTVNYVSLRDINATGGAAFKALNSVDLGDNAGWTITGATPLQLYWVGGSGNWSDVNHWSATSGGPGGACIPTAVDDVHFDKNSFTVAGQNVNIDVGNAVCRDMSWTGALNNPAFKALSPNNGIRIYGSLTLIKAMTWSVSKALPSPSFVNVSFESLSPGRTITSAGQQLNKVAFNGIGGGWILKDLLQCADTVSLNHGSLDTKGNGINCLAFASITDNARVLNITNSIINTNTWNVTGSNFTLSADKSTIYCGTLNHQGGIALSPATYYNVVFQSADNNWMTTINCTFNNVTEINSSLKYLGSGNTVNVFTVNDGMTYNGFKNDVIHKLIVHGNGRVDGDSKIDTATFYDDAFIINDNTFGKLTFSPGGTYKLFNGTQFITSSLTANGTCTDAITIQSYSTGTQVSIKKTGGDVVLNYVSLRDIRATGGAIFTANNSVDLGDNSGWTIISSMSRQLYWVGGTGNWNDTNHWALSSDGPGGACIPTAVDDVHFDKNSFKATGQGVTVNVGNAVCRDMNWTGVANNTAFRTAILPGSISIYGSLKLVAGVVCAIDISFESVTPGRTVTTANVYLKSVTFNGIGGGWALMDNLLSSEIIALYNGSLDTKGNDMSCQSFFSPPDAARTLTITNSNITAHSWQTYGDNFKLIAGNSTLTCTYFGQDGRPATYNNVILLDIAHNPYESPYMQSTNCTFNKITAIDKFAYKGSGNTVNFFSVNKGMDGVIQNPEGPNLGPGFTNDIIHKLVVHGLGLVNGGSKIDTAIFYNDADINGSNTFGTATFSPGSTYTLQSGKTQSITDSLMLRGNGCFPIRLRSSSAGSPSIISKASKNVAADYVEMRDQTATGGANFFAGRFSSDVSGNSGWIFKNAPGYSYGLGPDTSYCIADGGLLIKTDNFNGGISWLWQDGSTKPTYRATKPGSYWVQVNYAPDCFFRDTINVAVNSLPTAVASNNTPICIGDTLKLHASGGTSYQWTGPGGFSSNLQNPVILNAAASLSGTYSVIAKSGGCESPPATTVATVASGLKVDVNISASSGPVCAGTNITFTAVPVNGGNKPFYQWKQNGTNIGTNSPTFTTNALANNDKIWCVLTSSFNCADPATNPAKSNAIVVKINAVLPPDISISTPSNNICAGTTVTFTAKPVNGGTLPVYQWKVNGQNAGTNSVTFSSNSLVSGDVISCVLTSNAACVATADATSNNITMAVNQLLSPKVSIAVSANNVCAGTVTTFTAKPVNGGASPTYQWKVNGQNAGTNSATFSSNSLANNDVVSCMLTSNAACIAPADATSNNIIMAVNPLLNPVVSIVASANNICAGTMATFTAKPVNGGALPTYQWKVNGQNAGTNNVTFSTNALANNDVVSCVMTSNAPCATPVDANSNNIIVAVNQSLSAAVSILESANNICAGTMVTFTAKPVNGGTSPAYQWKVNGQNAGTNSAIFSSNLLANNDVVSCVLTSNSACAIPADATSNSIAMAINPSLSPAVSIVASANNICAGTMIVFTAKPVSGGASPVYQWKVNGQNAGTNSAAFSTNMLVNNDVVSCLLTSNAACATPVDASSNNITMVINPLLSPVVNVSTPINNICAGTMVIFTATPINGGSSPSYQWQVNGQNAGTNSSTFSSSTLTNNDVISCVLTSNAACIAPADATSNKITMAVTSSLSPAVSILESANNICTGTMVTFTAKPMNGGALPAYQWKVNGQNAGTNSATFSSNLLANNDIVSCELTSNAACAVPAGATSNNITVVVNPSLSPAVSIVASVNNICAGTMVTFTATPINGGGTPLYQWKVNGQNTGTNSAIFNSSTLVNGDVISCVLTSNAACATPVDASSNNITMVINPLLSPAVSILGSANNICAGTMVIFTAAPINGGSSPSYQWQVNGQNAGTNSATFSSNSLTNNDVISCVLTSNAACIALADAGSNNITMVVNPLSIPSVSIAVSVNNICAGVMATFNATPVNGGASPSYQWKVNGQNAGTNSVTFSSDLLANNDVVSCVLTSSAACAAPAGASSNSIAMKIYPAPSVHAGGDKVINDGNGIILNASVTGSIADITWSPADGLSSSKILNPTAKPSSTTLYTLTIQTTDGCVASDKVKVTVRREIVVPNTFTPNGDGVNDVWNIKYLQDYQNCIVKIFDRYGQQVYTSKGYGTAWDGTMQNKRLPVGTYYYIINLNDGTKALSGWVAIIR